MYWTDQNNLKFLRITWICIQKELGLLKSFLFGYTQWRTTKSLNLSGICGKEEINNLILTNNKSNQILLQYKSIMICNIWYEIYTCSTPRYNWNVVESGVKHHKPFNVSYKKKPKETRLIPNNKQVQKFLVLSTNDCFINKLY